MGSPTTEPGRGSYESQFTVVHTRELVVSEYEVTQGRWVSITGYNPTVFSYCNIENSPCPVDSVDFYSAAAYANKLSELEGLQLCYTVSPAGCADQIDDWKDGDTDCTEATFVGLDCTGYRLPTEAEWEYFYRAGTTSAFYSGAILSTVGVDTNLHPIAWYKANSGGVVRGVGQKLANGWGLYDVAGNVFEWTYDVACLYPAGQTVADYYCNVVWPNRTVRGGSWAQEPSLLRAAQRLFPLPEGRYSDVGFRLVRTLP